MRTTQARHSGIDFMRTLAILIMLVANTLPYAQSVHPPDWLRLLCSLAAPLFIFLSGYSIHLSHRRIGLAAYIPAASVLLAAILLDMTVWRVFPFLEFDVLYLISFGLFVNTALYNYAKLTACLALLQLILAPIAMNYFTYRFDMDEIYILSASTSITEWWELQPIQRWLIDGWFPILPWLYFALMGNIFWYYQKFLFSIREKLLTLCVIGFITLAWSQLSEIQPPLRSGYVEVFYPLEYTHIILSTFWIVALSLWIIPQSKFLQNNMLNVLGRRSKLVYISHVICLGCLVENIYHPETMIELIIVIALLFIFILLISFLSEKQRVIAVTSRLPLLLRRALGL